MTQLRPHQGEAHSGLPSQQASEKEVGRSAEPRMTEKAAEEDVRAQGTFQNARGKGALEITGAKLPGKKG